MDFLLKSKRKWQQERHILSPLIKLTKERREKLYEREDDFFHSMVVVICLVLAALFIIGSCKPAKAEENYTNEQIANAIRKAEGVWTYGIKTARCSTESECREICIRTIENNRKRYVDYGKEQFPTFLEFLASRYCPTTGNLTRNERRLNVNWINNVRYFLSKKESK